MKQNPRWKNKRREAAVANLSPLCFVVAELAACSSDAAKKSHEGRPLAGCMHAVGSRDAITSLLQAPGVNRRIWLVSAAAALCSF
ncbi:hypothetical protein V6N13_051190 [Hibiscus sabdariffa]|uniref:Secreted protein n=1 Tax=Hibiscus sabdariffa TaxID=183260 RepID=A0ABR2T3N2_9ROSI